MGQRAARLRQRQVEQGRPHQLGNPDQVAAARAARRQTHLSIGRAALDKEALMRTIFLVLSFVLAGAAIAQPSAAAQQQQATPQQDPVSPAQQTQQERQVTQPGNNAPVYPAIQSATPPSTTIPAPPTT